MPKNGVVGEAGDPPASEINDLSEKCGDNALLNGKGNFEPSPHLESLLTIRAMGLGAEGQMTEQQWLQHCADTPGLEAAWQERSRGREVSGWQPIETAPTDWFRTRGRFIVGRWHQPTNEDGEPVDGGDWSWVQCVELGPQGWLVSTGGFTGANGHAEFLLGEPTHWMPLPASPAAIAKATTSGGQS